MPELIDVPLNDLEVQNEYVVIFPTRDEIHQAYLTEFIEGHYGEFLFEVKGIKSDPQNATINIGDRFTITPQEVTTDIRDRTKYMVLREQPIYFPSELEYVDTDTDIDHEVTRLLNNRDIDEETERTRMLQRLILGRRPLESPLPRSSPNTPTPHNTYRTGGKKHHKRTCKRVTRKYKRNRSKRRRVYKSRKKRKNSRRRR